MYPNDIPSEKTSISVFWRKFTSVTFPNIILYLFVFIYTNIPIT